VRVDEHAMTVALARPGMQIDFGGIAKGYAADAAVAAMRHAGATGGIIAVVG
jgi:thiamine biosynthesis lipoprotein